MTIYIHFGDKARATVRLHNVQSVEDDGVFAVRVRMQFTDDNPRFEGVSHVALETTRS